VGLVAAVEEWASARKTAGPIPLVDAVRFYAADRTDIFPSRTVAQVADEFVESLRCKDDRAIRRSINGFFGEAWFNLFKILCDATSRLPNEAEEASSLKLVGTEYASANVKPRAGMASC
jgi:hypothetical protein